MYLSVFFQEAFHVIAIVCVWEFAAGHWIRGRKYERYVLTPIGAAEENAPGEASADAASDVQRVPVPDNVLPDGEHDTEAESESVSGLHFGTFG